MVVAALALDGLDDERSNRAVPNRVSRSRPLLIAWSCLTHYVVISFSTPLRNLFSSAAFSSACCSSGYFKAGNSACGQLNEGISSLCTALERVVLGLPNSRPWNEFT
jgi:hypothetical protein